METDIQNKISTKGSKLLGIILMVFALVFSPVSIALNPGSGNFEVKSSYADAAGLIDVGLLNGQALDATYNSTTKKLTLDITGYLLLDVGLLQEQHYYYEFPEEFASILALPNFKDAVQIDYDQRLLLGILPISSGTIDGRDLEIDTEKRIVSGTRFGVLDISALSTMSAKLTVDLNVLEEVLPSSDLGYLDFHSAATRAGLVDLNLITSEGASDRIATIQNNDLTANPVTDQDTQVTGIKKSSSGLGTGLSNVTVRVFNGATELGTTTVSNSANQPYAISIPQQLAGTELTIRVYDIPVIGSPSPIGQPLTLTVLDATAPEAPVVDNVTDTDTVVTGTGEAGTTVTVFSPVADESWTGTVDGGGNYSVTIPTQQKYNKYKNTYHKSLDPFVEILF